MKRNFKLENLDCANCAAKIERAINELDGVEECTINFMALKMTLVADDEKYADIQDQAQKIITKLEPDVIMKRC